MKILLVGHPQSQHIVPASKYLTSKYLQPGFEIEYLNYTGPIATWALFVRRRLQEISDRHVIFALDDYLVAGFNREKYAYIEKDILLEPDTVCVKLCNCSKEEQDEYPITTQYCLWDREYLIWILSQVGTPWEFEVDGSKIFKETGIKYKSISAPCIDYFTNSSLSSRWEGINVTGVRAEDVQDMIWSKMLPNRKIFFDTSPKEPSRQPASTQNHSTKAVVFGGSGFLGHSLIDRLIDNGYTKITAVARNEGGLVALKQKFPNVSIMVGDIADPWTVKSAMHDAEEVYLLSAMKHVGLAEEQVQACLSTNITGTMNVIKESLITKPKVLVFISSDKAAQGTGVYGCTKKIGEKLMVEAEKINPDTKYRVIRYGNVWASTGSIATKWKAKMEKGEEVILTDPDASRFFWTATEAVDLIFESVRKAPDANPHIPHMKAARMGMVLEACMDVYGYVPVKTIGLQLGENRVETMDGITFSDQVEQFSKDEFKEKFLGVKPLPLKEWVPDELDQSTSTKITAVLITREKEYPKIVAERLDTGFFDEIIVVTECTSIADRYLAAERASNEIIFVQDDDAMVNYQELFKKYNGQITNAMPKDFVEKYAQSGCTLVGWGCYFPKSMIGVLEKFAAKYGKDDKHLLREADRIFTAMNQPFNTVIMPHEDLPQTGDRMGYQPDHYTSMDEALVKAMSFYGQTV